MNNWIILASISPFLWACSNMVDEYLVRNHFSTKPYLLILAAAILTFLPATIMLAFYPPAWEVAPKTIIILGLLEIFCLASFVPYVKAIQLDGASVAVPLFQLIPVITFLMGWIILGETVSTSRILASALIIISAIAITWNFKTNKIHFKTFYLMSLCCVGISMYTIAIRYIMYDLDWFSTFIWASMGVGVAGILAAIILPKPRKDLIETFSGARWTISSLFVIQALLDLGSGGLFIVALSLAPASGLVATMNGLQPFYILILAAICGYFMSTKFEPMAMDKSLAWKAFCVVLLFIGVAVLSLSE